MKLSAFLKELQPYLAGSRRSGEYVRELLIQAVRDDYPINGRLYSLSETTLRSYCNGSRMGSTIAKDLIRFFEHKKFAHFIDGLPSAARDGVLDVVRKHGVAAKIGSLGNECADMLFGALVIAAQGKPGKQGRIDDGGVDRLVIEESIGQILDAVLDLDVGNQLGELRYEAVKVSEKLEEYPGLKANSLLVRRITRNVVEYYRFIQEQIGLLEGHKTATFLMAAKLVQNRYMKLKAEGLPAESVFYDMSGLIKEESKVDCDEACEILISFFIQNCEVFDAPSK